MTTTYKHADWYAGRLLRSDKADAEECAYWERIILQKLAKAPPPGTVTIGVRVEIDYQIGEALEKTS